MYKYIGINEKGSMQTRVLGNDISIREFPRNLKADVKTKKIFRFCNPPEEIITETEGTTSVMHVIIWSLPDRGHVIIVQSSVFRKIGWKFNTRRYFSIYKAWRQRATGSHSKHKHSKLWRRF